MPRPSAGGSPGCRPAVSDRPPIDSYVAAGRARGFALRSLAMRLLEVLRSSDKPQRAYDLLAQASPADRLLSPTSVYRQLRRLSDAGLIIPVATQSSFVISPDPNVRQWLVLVCARCGRPQLVDGSFMTAGIDCRARLARFTVRRVHLECTALCAGCRRQSDAPVTAERLAIGDGKEGEGEMISGEPE